MQPIHRLATLALLLVPLAAAAQDSPPTTDTIPTSTMLGFESVKLPGGEKLGLVGTSVLFQVGESFGIGPAVYGAATGQRGGFFVGGVEAQYRMPLGRDLSLAAGLYAGGGGGGSAPVGSGLMLRPAATLLYDIGPKMQVGLSWSMVKFPSGQIDGRQLGIVFAWRDGFRHHDAGDEGKSVFAGRASGFGFDRLAATVGAYQFTEGSGRKIGLAGARFDRRTGVQGLTIGIETAAAAAGNAAGYMEILGTAGWSVAPFEAALPSLRVGVRGSFGLGGGGAVPTGGGTMGKLLGTIEVSPMKGWTIGLDAGYVHGFNGTLRARQAQAWLGMDLEPALDGNGEPFGPIIRSEWTAAIQHHARAERRDGTTRPLDTIGLKLTRSVSPYLYLTGQAHSAFAGGAGAYSIGLVGAGIATRPGSGPRIGFEALIGAAGGGGVATSGGAIAQGLLWAGMKAGDNSEWRVGVGGVRSLRGGLRSPIFEIAWSKAFGFAGR